MTVWYCVKYCIHFCCWFLGISFLFGWDVQTWLKETYASLNSLSIIYFYFFAKTYFEDLLTFFSFYFRIYVWFVFFLEIWFMQTVFAVLTIILKKVYGFRFFPALTGNSFFYLLLSLDRFLLKLI